MKFAQETEVDTFSATRSVVQRAVAIAGDFDCRDRRAPMDDSVGAGWPAIGLGGLSFVRLRGRSAASCGQALKSLCDATTLSRQLLVLLEGELTVIDASGRSVTLRRGDMALVDGRRGLNLLSLQGIDAWLIDLSAPTLARWLGAGPAVAVHCLQGDRGWAKVLCAYLRNWQFEPLREVSRAFEKEIIGEHVMSLLSMALLQCGAVRDTQMLSARDRDRYAQMRQWVRENYADSEISVTALASCFGMSTRYVHRVFLKAGAGETFLDAVRSDRLEAAARWLRTSTRAPVSVAEIASGCGFSDPGYFGRMFRRKYGSSPTEFSGKLDGRLDRPPHRPA